MADLSSTATEALGQPTMIIEGSDLNSVGIEAADRFEPTVFYSLLWLCFLVLQIFVWIRVLRLRRQGFSWMAVWDHVLVMDGALMSGRSTWRVTRQFFRRWMPAFVVLFALSSLALAERHRGWRSVVSTERLAGAGFEKPRFREQVDKLREALRGDVSLDSNRREELSGQIVGQKYRRNAQDVQGSSSEGSGQAAQSVYDWSSRAPFE